MYINVNSYRLVNANLLRDKPENVLLETDLRNASDR